MCGCVYNFMYNVYTRTYSMCVGGMIICVGCVIIYSISLGVCVCERVCLNMSVLGVSCVFVNVHV